MLERALTAHLPHLQIENQRHQDSVQPLALGTGHGSGVWNAKLGIDSIRKSEGFGWRLGIEFFGR